MQDEEEAIKIVMQMVQHLCTRFGWQNDLSAGKSKANITVVLRDGTRQKVSIFGRKDMNGQPVMVFYTAVAKEDSVNDFLSVLRTNSTLDHCHMAIVKNMLVVLDTQLLITADYAEVAKKIENVASQGKALEDRFRGGGAS